MNLTLTRAVVAGLSSVTVIATGIAYFVVQVIA